MLLLVSRYWHRCPLYHPRRWCCLSMPVASLVNMGMFGPLRANTRLRTFAGVDESSSMVVSGSPPAGANHTVVCMSNCRSVSLRTCLVGFVLSFLGTSIISCLFVIKACCALPSSTPQFHLPKSAPLLIMLLYNKF